MNEIGQKNSTMIFQERFQLFLKKDFQYAAKDVTFLPLSGYTGANIQEPVSKEICPWYDGPSLLQLLDLLKPPERNENAPLRIPVTDRYKEMGLVHILGKVEGGVIQKGQNVVLMPSKIPLKIAQLTIDDRAVKSAGPGENVRLGIAGGIEESDVSIGNVICDPSALVPVISEFVAQLAIIDLIPTNPLFTAGYEAVMHIHTCIRDVTVTKLISEFDKKNKKE